MSDFRRVAARRQTPQKSILSTLQMVDTRAALPAEILVTVLDYLPVADLIRFARTSRRMQEMVYDDTRWVARLKSMGLWDEAEARRRFEKARQIRRQQQAAARTSINGGTSPLAPGTANTTVFDAAVEARRQKQPVDDAAAGRPEQGADGFETLRLDGPTKKPPHEDRTAVLDVLKNVRSIRGQARQEYGKVYGALAPFYFNLAQAKSHMDPVLFRVFRDPEGQAKMLANLQVFSRSDWAHGWRDREDKLSSMSSIFEGAVMREFEQGYEVWDVDGRMRKYAHVLSVLNGGNAASELFIAKHPVFNDRTILADPLDCINQASHDSVTLDPSRNFLEALSNRINEQATVLSRIFPDPTDTYWSFLDKIREDIIMEYVTPLLDESHERNTATYLKAVSGLFGQCVQFARSLAPPGGMDSGVENAKELALKIFEPHLDLYLQEELDFFTKYAERQVANWDQRLSEQDASVESFYMANFTRQADKNDFLSSFKKVVMMPVTVLPTALSAPFGSSKSTLASSPNGASIQPSAAGALGPSRLDTPGFGGSLERRGSPLPSEAPTDELKAKAALMANRLEGIKSLFSIEVALDLVHAAKASLGRAVVFVSLGGQAGEEAREQCETIFVVLLKILGQTHVKNGFAKALDHLSQYNPRDVTDHSQKAGVAPLVTFIELVNVGDLISQMIDVFYEQQMAAPHIADRNNFLDPAGLAKKKWEQMLDENVAAGLNKGIDVLMDEVEYLFATTQPPTDFNPPPSSGEKPSPADPDIGPTQTAKRIVELVSSHTKMLVGSTEKTMLDVFNGEVGLRLFTAICKHLKRQRISTDGAIKLIADMNLYFEYIRSLKNPDLLAYFKALRELSQIYLIDARHAKEMATIIADSDRFGGIFRAEEVYEYAERRADWYQVKKNVEKAMYGLECMVM